MRELKQYNNRDNYVIDMCFCFCVYFFYFFKKTNLTTMGLVSADRSNKATLLLTTPRCLPSSLQGICGVLLYSVDLSFVLRFFYLLHKKPGLGSLRSYSSAYSHTLRRCHFLAWILT